MYHVKYSHVIKNIGPAISFEVLTPLFLFLYKQGRGTECCRASPYPRDLLDLRCSLGELQHNHFPVPFHNIQLSSSKNLLIIKLQLSIDRFNSFYIYIAFISKKFLKQKKLTLVWNLNEILYYHWAIKISST